MRIEVGPGRYLELPDGTSPEQAQAAIERYRVMEREHAPRAAPQGFGSKAATALSQFASGGNELVGTLLDLPGVATTAAGRAVGLLPPDREAPRMASRALSRSGVVAPPVPGYEMARSAGAGAMAGAPFMAAPMAVLTGITGAVGEAGLGKVGEEVGGLAGETGGRVGRKVGETVGSLVGGAAPTLTGRARDIAMERMIGRHRAPNARAVDAAARREGEVPTAGMLGNQELKTREKQYMGRGGGAADATREPRERMLVRLRENLDEVARARGAQAGQVTPEMVGSDLGETSGRVAVDLNRRIEEMQEALMERVGRGSHVDVEQLMQDIRDIRPHTDITGWTPIETRLNHLDRMLPRDAQGNVLDHTIPYERLKDWRSNLGRTIDDAEGITGRNLDAVYGPTTEAMRRTAEREGVPMDVFDRIQSETRRLNQRAIPGVQDEGPIPALEQQVKASTTSPAAQAARMERDPEALLRLTESPRQDIADAMDRIAGNTIASRAQSTLGVDAANNYRQFANWWQNLPEEARLAIGGPQAQRLDDIATLARAADYPTQAGGFSISTGRTAGNTIGKVASMALGGGLGHMLDTQFHLPGVGAGLGTTAGLMVPGMVDTGMARLLQSDAARRALLREPVQAMTIDELLAALGRTGAQAGQ